GSHLAVTLATLPGVEVAYVCDVDEHYLGKAVEAVSKKQKTAPQGVGDFRRILDDKSIDAIVIATPDHWHTPAAILGCAAGKHVYVEKPCCQNAREGEWLLQAARTHDRHVQHGTQRRSWPGVQEGIQKLREGAIGRVMLAKAWYFNNRPTIGHGKEAPVPSHINWDLWQGPAPRRPFHDNFIHYNWHWFWHWGTGELGNNGVHFLDVARWGLGVDRPVRVTSGGGKYRYDDDQETPDTQNISLDFGDKTITWENRSWAATTPNDPPYDVAFFGESGSLFVHAGGYTIYDLKGKQVSTGKGEAGDAIHLQNFVNAMRENGKLNAEIAEGVSSATLCHLGNIAYRTGHTLHLDPHTKQILNDPDATALWGREYEKGWEPKV
ncbi:MAG TPA: Gfo/Idh/MocA family oxidoreductase, partial [Tepidisphaeraceae bacterium]|nr:Gfo/Idh/MocA family oxidoreductase [Tepidisphaeraceae bacterium]